MQNLLNKEFNVKAIGINNYGKGVVKLDSLLCFVDDLYPEEEALIRIVKQEKNLVYGKVINITKKSPHRIDSICKHSDDLGSCPFNNIDYEYELELKGNIIKNNLERALKFEIGHIDVISGDVIDGYRNKVTVFFSLDENNMPFFGSFKEGTKELGRIESCIQIKEEFIEIINTFLNLTQKYKLEIIDFKNKKGIVKGISIRKSEYTKKISVMILSRKDYINEYNEIANLLKLFNNNISSVSILVDNSFDTFIYKGVERNIIGTGEIIEKLGDMLFRVNNMSFLQVNTSCASKLYSDAIKLANLKPNYKVLDLYSGSGGISLNAAKYVDKVYGIEEVASAVENAKYNAALNNINNALFKACDAKDYHMLIKNENIDVVFIDPPRSGMKMEVIEQLLKDEYNQIIYISCDPYTLSRDLSLLSKKYILNTIKGYNMFLRTKHVESIVSLLCKTSREK